MPKSKKLAPVYIMDILQNRTDEEHVLLHNEIEDILLHEYGIDMERKAVSSNINMLIKEGLIESLGKKRGCYFDDHAFDDAELNLLIYSVLGNSAIPSHQMRDLISRLEGLGGPSFRSSGYSVMINDKNSAKDSSRKNAEIFYNIDTISDAIRWKHKIEFDYYRYDVDKTMKKSSTHTVSPYYVVMHNQRLYLIAYSDKYEQISHFRIDRIKNVSEKKEPIKKLKEVPGCEQGVDFSKTTSMLPYMFSDKAQKITFKADAEIIDQIIDWFGTDVIIKPDKNKGKITVALETSPTAMEYWAKQYLDKVEITAPISLRNKIRDSLEENLKKYSGKK